MSLKIDRVQLEIVIKNDKARQELRILEDESRKLQRELKKLPEGSDAFVKKSEELKKVTARMDELYDQIGLTGLSLKELGKRQRDLNAIMRNMDPRTTEYKNLKTQLDAVQNRMGELRGKADQSNLSIKKLADGFNRFALLGASVIAVVTGLAFKFSTLVKGNAELSDSFADVQKTTGLTATEVKGLYGELKKIDTRTSRKELLDLAYVAGKLGLSGEKNILGFVKAADKINVALGEELGDNAEESINAIGKIVDIFKVNKEFGIEEGMLKVGSAINSLGQASTANEGYIVDFTKRLGGIAPSADISVDKVMGLGATLDQLGQQVETSSTAVGQLFIAMGKRSEDFAKIANMNVKDFVDLLNTDANGALIKVLQGLKDNSTGLSSMAKAMDGMGLEGSRSIGIVSVLSNNIEILTQQQNLAKKSFDEGTSVLNEYNIKNETLGANLQKIGKAISGWFINSGFVSWTEKVVDNIADWIKLPLEEKMRDEQVEVNLLTQKLINQNISQEERLKAYKDLMAMQPKVLTGITQEDVATGLLSDKMNTLKTNLQEVNKEYVRNLLINKLREEQMGIADEIAENAKKLTELETEIINHYTTLSIAIQEEVAQGHKGREAWGREIEEVLNSGMSYNDQIRAFIEGEFYAPNTPLYRNLMQYRSLTNEIKETETELYKNIQDIDKQIENIAGKPVSKTEPTVTKKTDESGKPSGDVENTTNNKGLNIIKQPSELDIDLAIEKAINDMQAAIDKKAEDDEGLPGLELVNEENVEDESEYLIAKYKETLEGRKAMLKVYLDSGVISYEQYADEIAAIDKEIKNNTLKRVQETFGKIQELTQTSANIVNAIEEGANLETELRLKYGLITEEEADKERLKNRKKYADKQFQMEVAEILSSAAVAAIKTWEGYADMGPLGAILATAQTIALGTLTALQISNANKQRNIVKQLAKGKYDVIGKDDGNLYKNVPYTRSLSSGFVNNPVLVGETPEIVIDNAVSRRIATFNPEVLDIINYHRGKVTQFAEGKYNTISNDAAINTNNAVFDKMNNTLVYLVNTQNLLISKLSNLYAKIDYTSHKEEMDLMESIEGNASLGI